MKKRIFILTICITAIGAFLYWQYNKKWFVRKGIENIIHSKSNGLYKIYYDSSFIDETSGNANFYNLSLQSDSLQQLLYKNDSMGLSSSIFNIKIKEISIRGVNVKELLHQSSIQAKEIVISHPVIHIINTGKSPGIKLTHEDTLALYKRLIGNFKQIKADKIYIENGSFYISNGNRSPTTILDSININFSTFLIDSTRDYHNVLSYFVNDIIAKSGSLRMISPDGKKQFVIKDIEYNAPERFMQVNRIYEQQLSGDKRINYEIKKTRIANLYTDEFILNKKFKADSFISHGGSLIIYKSKSPKNGNKAKLEIDNDYISQILINNVLLNKTNLFIYDKQKPTSNPLLIKNLEFRAWDISHIDSASTLTSLLNNSKWKISTDELSTNTSNKQYRLYIKKLAYDKTLSLATASQVSLTPLINEQAFFASQKKQRDYSSIYLNNIRLNELNIIKLLTNEEIIATTITLQPKILIISDRTLPANETSKVGKFPHQLLLKIPQPIMIEKIFVQNGLVAYKEKSKLSGRFGTIDFKNINGIITNVSNIKSSISKSPLLSVNLSAVFANVSKLNTNWKLPLNTTNGSFFINGDLDSFKILEINHIIEPLGLASAKSGDIINLQFSMQGNDTASQGNVQMLYKNLKITLLDTLSKSGTNNKNALSLIANFLIKNENPSKGVTRPGNFIIQRDKTKSFFNIIWKGIYAGIKKTVLGKP